MLHQRGLCRRTGPRTQREDCRQHQHMLAQRRFRTSCHYNCKPSYPPAHSSALQPIFKRSTSVQAMALHVYVKNTALRASRWASLPTYALIRAARKRTGGSPSTNTTSAATYLGQFKLHILCLLPRHRRLRKHRHRRLVQNLRPRGRPLLT